LKITKDQDNGIFDNRWRWKKPFAPVEESGDNDVPDSDLQDKERSGRREGVEEILVKDLDPNARSKPIHSGTALKTSNPFEIEGNDISRMSGNSKDAKPHRMASTDLDHSWTKKASGLIADAH